MPNIPLPTGLKGDSQTPKQLERLINCYYERGQVGTLSPRPGIASFFTRYGFTRGQGEFQDKLYSVEADLLFETEIDANGVITRTSIGQIEGAQDCILVSSFTFLVIQIIGGPAYSWNGTTFAQITNPFYQNSVSVAYQSGQFVWVPVDGGPIFWSTGGDPNNIASDNFSDAEVKTDKNLAVIEWRGELIVFGTESIERQDYDPQANVYQNASASANNIGLVGGLVRFNDDLMFIGRPVNGTFSIYIYNGSPTRISNKAVDEILNLYSFEDLNTSRADFFSWRGEDQAVWHLSNNEFSHTLHFYGDFAFIKSNINGKETGEWVGQYITSFQGNLVVGDNDSNRAGILVEEFTDYGEKLEAEFETYVRSAPRSNFFVKRVYGTMTTGQTNEDRQIELSVTEDGVHYGPYVPRKFEGRGIFNEEISWGPIGRFDNFMGIKMRWVGDIKVPIDGIDYE